MTATPDDQRRKFAADRALCPAWCNGRHLTKETIWFARHEFHMGDAVAVHLPAVAEADGSPFLLEDTIKVYVESSGPAASTQRPATVNLECEGNLEGTEGYSVLDADQAEAVGRALLAAVRQVRGRR